MEVSEDAGIWAECTGETYYFCSEGCRDRFLKDMACKRPRTSLDLIIIRSGSAGLTAAVCASTLKIDAFLIAKDLGGQAIDSTKIENYEERFQRKGVFYGNIQNLSFVQHTRHSMAYNSGPVGGNERPAAHAGLQGIGSWCPGCCRDSRGELYTVKPA